MTLEESVMVLFEGAESAWQTALILARSQRGDHALFFLHLALEKLLKSLYLEKFKKPAPYTHSLGRLVSEIGIATDENDQKQLEEISGFNISGRYEDYKYDLYKRATKKYVDDWFKLGNSWRSKFLKKKKIPNE